MSSSLNKNYLDCKTLKNLQKSTSTENFNSYSERGYCSPHSSGYYAGVVQEVFNTNLASRGCFFEFLQLTDGPHSQNLTERSWMFSFIRHFKAY